MASGQVHTEGQKWILELAFSEEQAVPESFYVGLCSNVSIAKTATLTDLNELTGDGYDRQVVSSAASGEFTWMSLLFGTTDRKVTATTVTFSVPSGVSDWETARYWFLATTVNDSGVLVASGQTSDMPVDLESGDNLDIEVTIAATS